MRKIIYFLLNLVLIFSACTKVYIPECPEDNRKKVEVAFNINTEMEVENFTRASIIEGDVSKEVYYRIYEKVDDKLTPILEAMHNRKDTLKLDMLEGEYEAEFFTVNSYNGDGNITLDSINKKHLNHVYRAELDFTVTDTSTVKKVILKRVVSAIRFVRSSENHSKFIELKRVYITSHKTMNLYSGDISTNGTWLGAVNPTETNGQEWNYVFEDTIGFEVIFHAENGHKDYTLKREKIELEPNKKYTVTISRNNTDGAIDNSFEIIIDDKWAGEEEVDISLKP